MADWKPSGDELTLAEELWLQAVAALDAGANQVLGRNNADTAYEWKTIAAGSNVTVTHSANTITIASTGGGGTTINTLDDVGDVNTTNATQNDLLQYRSSEWTDVTLHQAITNVLTDPAADRILFWDDSESAMAWLATGNSIAITTTTIDTIQDIRTTASPEFTALNIGHATDTTLARSGAGDLTIEGNVIYRAGGTDVALADGGTGASLSDPNDDRVFMWDDSAGATVLTDLGTGLTTNATPQILVDQATAFAWTAAHTHTVAGLVKTLTNTSDAASVQVAIFQGDRATMADADEAYLSFQLSDDGGTQKEIGRLTWVATDVNAGTSVDGQWDFAVMTAGTLADEMQLDGTALSPSTTDGLALGTSLLNWSDLFLDLGAVINFDGGDVTITHSANALDIDGGVVDFGSAPTVNAAAIYYAGGTDVALADGGTGASLVDPNDDRIFMWDDSAGATALTDLGTGLTTNATPQILVDQATAFAWTAAHTHTVAGLVSTLTNSSDAASVQVAILQGDRATMADNDEAYLTLRLSNDGGTQTEFARLTWVATDVNAGTSVDGRIDFAVVTAGSLADELQLDGTALSPSTTDGLALGTSLLNFSDLFLDLGAVINFDDGDVTLTHAANRLTIAGGEFDLGGATDNILVAGADPKRTMSVMAGAMWPSTTSGCATLAKVEAATNDVDYQVLDFDQTSQEFAQFSTIMPDGWDAGTVTFKAIWTAAAGTGAVVWELQGRAYANDDAIDQAWGTAVEVTDTLIATGDIHETSESTAVTLAGTPTAGEYVHFRIARDPANASDTLTADARLIGVRIEWTRAQFND